MNNIGSANTGAVYIDTAVFEFCLFLLCNLMGRVGAT